MLGSDVCELCLVYLFVCVCVCVYACVFNLVALENRGSPCEVISVACEGPWLSKHTYYIIYCMYYMCFLEQINIFHISWFVTFCKVYF